MCLPTHKPKEPYPGIYRRETHPHRVRRYVFNNLRMFCRNLSANCIWFTGLGKAPTAKEVS